MNCMRTDIAGMAFTRDMDILNIDARFFTKDWYLNDSDSYFDILFSVFIILIRCP